MSSKVVEVKVWGKSVCAICVGENIINYILYFLPMVLFSLCALLLNVSCVYCCHLMCICYTMCALLFYFRCRTAG
jgi:hypothetical protein